MSIYEAIVDLIGNPPAGYEIIVWVVCSLILLYLIRCAFGIIATVFEWIGGK